jgi:3-hydroxyisobutyrate dehydrogenase-like beta-hydroxyacid dehydrogenase
MAKPIRSQAARPRPCAHDALAQHAAHLLGTVTLAGAVEGLVLATKAGLDLALLLDVVRVSSGASALLERHGAALVGRQPAAAATTLARCRARLEAAMRAARRHGVPTPLAALTHAWLLHSPSHDDRQWPAALAARYEALAGCRLAAAPTGTAPGLRAATPRLDGSPVGFIGLGRIGKPIAETLRRAGLPLIVHNRSQAAVDDLVRQGATRAASPAEVAAQADVVLTCLPDNEAVERVYLGPLGLVEALRPGAALIDLGTTALALTRRLHDAIATQGGHFVDAPISGGIPAAQEGRLTVIIGASEEGFERAAPVLAALGERLFHVGPPGSGQVAKQVNNMLLGTTTAAGAEALALGVSAGQSADTLIAALLASPAASWALRMRGPKMAQRDFRPLFTIDGRLKDSQAALALGQELHVPLPLAAAAHELYQVAAAHGHGADDFAAVMTAYEVLGSDLANRRADALTPDST